ncbi:MAG: hypothetical protein R3F56_23950 [Planctomycetota bacterium]
MPSSPTSDARRILAELDATFAEATRTLAAGDLGATSTLVAHVDALLGAIAVESAAGHPMEAALAGVRERHARLLAAASSEYERVAVELGKVRTSRRAMRSYGWRRPTGDGGRSV